MALLMDKADLKKLCTEVETELKKANDFIYDITVKAGTSTGEQDHLADEL